MPLNRAKKWIVAAAIFQISFSMVLAKGWLPGTFLCLYGFMWLVSGLKYQVGKPSYWFSVGLTVPWASVFFIRFGGRIFYWFAYGGDSPDGIGSPLAFLIGWAFEMPAVIGMALLCYMLIYDYMALKKSVKPTQ
jgi:hypothetical protein